MIKRGDLMFRQGKFHHTMVVSDPKNFSDVTKLNASEASQSIEIIHAASVDSGVYREEIDIAKSEGKGNVFNFYRPTDIRLANGVEFAMLWAHYRSETGKVTKKKAKGSVTHYSYKQLTKSGADMSRYSGAQAYLHEDVSAPFEFDALYRSFKWASRQRTGFSKNRGTTCCAFITACFQASAVDHYAKAFKNIAMGFKILTELRNKKMPLDQRESQFIEVGDRKKKIAFKALREYSNAGGFKSYFNINDYCRFLTKEIHGTEKTIQDLFPSSLLVDAKYNYSKNFERMIKAPNSGWMKVL